MWMWISCVWLCVCVYMGLCMCLCVCVHVSTSICVSSYIWIPHSSVCRLFSNTLGLVQKSDSKSRCMISISWERERVSWTLNVWHNPKGFISTTSKNWDLILSNSFVPFQITQAWHRTLYIKASANGYWMKSVNQLINLCILSALKEIQI